MSLVVLRRCEDVVYLARRRLASAFSLPLVAAQLQLPAKQFVDLSAIRSESVACKAPNAQTVSRKTAPATKK